MSEAVRIILIVAIVAYVIGRQLIGEPLRGKRVVVLPVVLVVIGVTDLNGSDHHVHPADVACLVAGGIVVAAIGVAQASALRIENRNGYLWGQMPVAALWLWVLLVVSRVLTTLVADGVDAKVAASSSTILLMLGINRLAQAAVVVPRAMTAGVAFAPEKDGRSLLTGLTGNTVQPPPATPQSPVTRSAPPRTDGSRAGGTAGIDWATVAGQVGSFLENRRRDR